MFFDICAKRYRIPIGNPYSNDDESRSTVKEKVNKLETRMWFTRDMDVRPCLNQIRNG